MSALAKLLKPSQWGDLLAGLSEALPWALAGLIVLFALVVLAVWWVIRGARRAGEDSLVSRFKAWLAQIFLDLRTYREAAPLRREFHDSVEALDRAVGGAGGRYKLPWLMILGETAAGKSTLLGKMSLSLPCGGPFGNGTSSEADCGFWAFDQGVVLDVRGEYVLRKGGRSADDASWRVLLKLIRRARKRRPLDALVLTIPATAFGSAAEAGSQVLAEAGRRAEALYQKVWQAQASLGMQLPVYVVITKADLLPGFEVLSRTVGAGFERQMFGWATPYSRDTEYSNKWVDEAISETENQLSEIYSDFLGGTALGARSSDPMAFSGALAGSRETLRVYLNQLFSPSAFHDPFPFRGLFFVGGKFEDLEPASVESETKRSPSEVLFGAELFRDKVFRETSLGRPSEVATAARRRVRRRLALATIAVLAIGGLGLWRARAELQSKTAKLEPFLEVVEKGLQQNRAGGKAGDLLTQARIVPKYRLGTALIPASWAGPPRPFSLRRAFRPAWWEGKLDRDIRGVTTSTYARNVIPGMREEASSWLAREHQFEPAESATPQDYTESIEFRQLEEFVAEPLNVLIQRTYGQKLEPPTRSAATFYRRIFDDLQREPLGSPLPLDALASKLADDFLKSLFANNPVTLDLALIDDLSRQIEEAGPTEGPDAELYAALQKALAKLEADLASPELAWMADSTLDLGPAFEQLLGQIAASPSLGKEVSAGLATETQTGFRDFKKELTDARLRFGDKDPVLAQKDGEVQLELSEASKDLSTALTDFEESVFASDPERNKIQVDPGPNAYFTWNADLLKRAAALYDTYQDFTNKDLELLPEELQPDVGRLAAEDLGGAVVDFTARAQQTHDLSEPFTPGFLENVLVKSQLVNLQLVEKDLETIFDVLNELAFYEDAEALRQALSLQRETLLQDLEALLATRDVYQTVDGDFSWWGCTVKDGCKPALAEGAFDQPNAGALPAYLAVQRNLVSSVALDYAKPVLDYMPARLDNASTQSLATFWDDILQDLEDYKNKKAGNSISKIEEFITATMPEIDLAGCLRTVPDLSLRDLSGDFFTKRLQELQISLRKRCVELVEREGAYGYREIAGLFECRLEGRFPFKATEPGIGEPEATPEDVAAFYELFDLYQDVIGQVPKGSAIYGPPCSQGLSGCKDPAATEGEIRDFMGSLRTFRSFVASYLDDPKKNPEPALSVEAAFRVNRSREQGANQIIGWSLDVGDKTLSMGGEDIATRWAYGAPVTLRLRWAEDSLAQPVGSGDSPYSTIRNRTVVFEYPTQWALLSLLRDHPSAPGDFDDPREDRPVTLKLEVDTASAQALAAASTSRPVGTYSIVLDTRSDTFWEVIETLKRGDDTGADSQDALAPPPDTLELAIASGPAEGEAKGGILKNKKRDRKGQTATTSVTGRPVPSPEVEPAKAFVRLLLTTLDKKEVIPVGPIPFLAPILPGATTETNCQTLSEAQ